MTLLNLKGARKFALANQQVNRSIDELKAPAQSLFMAMGLEIINLTAPNTISDIAKETVQYFSQLYLNSDEFKLIFQDRKLFNFVKLNSMFEGFLKYFNAFYQALTDEQQDCLSES